MIPRPEGELIFTLDSADYAYRVLVETMNEGTVTLARDGTILYCNRMFAAERLARSIIEKTAEETRKKEIHRIKNNLQPQQQKYQPVYGPGRERIF